MGFCSPVNGNEELMYTGYFYVPEVEKRKFITNKDKNDVVSVCELHHVY